MAGNGDVPMVEITVTTTDQAFLEDLNSARISGVMAVYRPTMAFDTAEHILTIVVTVAASTGFTLLADWVRSRLQSKPPPTQLTINNITVNVENVVTVITNYNDARTKIKPHK